MTTMDDNTIPPDNTKSAGVESEDVFILPASLGQERFWALDRMNPGNPTWNVPVRFRLQGPLNVDFVQSAFNEILQRHETLRTTFTVADGRPTAVIKPSLHIDVPVTDLRHLAKAERDAEVDRLSMKEARWRFDLAIGPLFRVSLLRVEDNEHVLLVTPHHSVLDYWSVGLISNELGALYESYSSGREPLLPDLPIQYGDFAVWQREQTDSPAVQQELSYWKTQLRDLPPLEFPTDRPRPNFPTYDATITSILLPVELTDAIRDLANREGATFFNTMLAALSIVLHQYTGQVDFGVSTQVAGRTNVEMERLIGLFINNIVLRMNLSGDPVFSQLIATTQDTGLQALANQNVRFEQVLRELRPQDYPSHHTLFRLNFICQRDPVKPLEFAKVKLTVIPSKSQGALYDLNVFLVLRNEGWRLACEYNTDLFEASTIVQLLNDYRKLLESIAEDSNRKLSAFPIAEGAAKRNAGAGPGGVPGVAAKAPTPTDANPDALASIAPASANVPTTRPANEAPSGKSAIEYYALPASVVQKRFWTLEELIPGNPALHMRACVRLHGLLSVSCLQTSLQKLVDRHETLRTTFEKSDRDLTQVIASSGKIPLSVTSLEDFSQSDRDAKLKTAIREEAAASFDLGFGPLIRAKLFRLSADDHVLVITTHHILVDGWSQSVIQRDLWTIYDAVVKGIDPPMAPLTIQYGDFVHSQLQWLESEEAREQVEFWKNQLLPPLPALQFPYDKASRQHSVSEPMETLLLSRDLTGELKNFGQSNDLSMFMLLLTGYAAMLARHSGQEEILIGSPVAHRGPETEGLVGPFAGPVMLRLNLRGNPTMQELLKRVRDITVNALGHADLPFEVLLEELDSSSLRGRNPFSQCYFFYQNAFLQPRQLGELTVSPLPDFGLGTHFELQMGLLERGEGIRAQLEFNPARFESATIRRLLEDFQSVLKVIAEDPDCRLSELRTSAEWKPGVYTTAPVREVESAGEANETERQLQLIWQNLLGIRSIGLHHDYFEMGGNSILAVRLFAEIEKVFRTKLPLSTLFEAPTIAQLSRILRRDDSTRPNWSPLVRIQKQGSKPPFFCVHGGAGNVLLYRDLSRRLGDDQPFYGLQCQGLDGKLPILTKIEDMASLYVGAIREVQPHGPYFLGGYCMGGTVALEMAQQLKAQGEEVGLLALFDTLNWAKVRPENLWVKSRYQSQRLWFHFLNFWLLSFVDKRKFFLEKFKVLRSRLTVWKGMLLGKVGGIGEGDKESLLLAQIWETNDRAILNYRPNEYRGVITDFRPLKQYSKYAPDMHWADIAVAGEDVAVVPSYPAGMLLEPFVAELARILADRLARANSPGDFQSLDLQSASASCLSVNQSGQVSTRPAGRRGTVTAAETTYVRTSLT